jgi:hypothetical protein
MTKITLSNEDTGSTLELNVYDNWKEINLRNYFKIIDLTQRKDELDENEFFVEMISIIANIEKEKLYDIPVVEFSQLASIITQLSPNNLKTDIQDHIVIKDINYVPKKNMSNLTINEMIWIKNKEKESNSSIDNMIGVLVILLRPGYQKTDEAGVIKWIQTPYNNDDFLSRKELFLDELSADVAIPLVIFFLSGSEG